VRRRQVAVGKSAALTLSAPSSQPVPQAPLTRRREGGRFLKAIAFALFMTAVAALWLLAPAVISWLTVQPPRRPPLSSGNAQLEVYNFLHRLLIGAAAKTDHASSAIEPRLLLFTPVVGVIAFVCSFRRPNSPAPHPSPRA
jgi:hypothetical protein